MRRTLQGVEAAVDFDGGKRGCGKLQFSALRELFRIKDAAPTLVSPAGDADADFARDAHGGMEAG
jgi:hypothetical protein